MAYINRSASPLKEIGPLRHLCSPLEMYLLSILLFLIRDRKIFLFVTHSVLNTWYISSQLPLCYVPAVLVNFPFFPRSALREVHSSAHPVLWLFHSQHCSNRSHYSGHRPVNCQIQWTLLSMSYLLEEIRNSFLWYLWLFLSDLFL